MASSTSSAAATAGAALPLGRMVDLKNDGEYKTHIKDAGSSLVSFKDIYKDTGYHSGGCCNRVGLMLHYGRW